MLDKDKFYGLKGTGRVRKGQKSLPEHLVVWPEEFERLVATAKSDSGRGSRDALHLFLILGNLGLRVSEALDAVYEDAAALERGLFAVRSRKKRRFVLDMIVLLPAEVDLVRSIMRERRDQNPPRSERLFPFSVRRAEYLFAYYAALAGLSKFKRLHGLRHTCGIMMWKATRDLMMVKKRLRHSSVKNSERYVDLDTEYQLELMKGKKVVV